MFSIGLLTSRIQGYCCRNLIKSFNKANLIGLQNLENVVAENPYPDFTLKEYYTSYITYHFDDAKKRSLNLFIDKQRTIRLLNKKI